MREVFIVVSLYVCEVELGEGRCQVEKITVMKVWKRRPSEWDRGYFSAYKIKSQAFTLWRSWHVTVFLSLT